MQAMVAELEQTPECGAMKSCRGPGSFCAGRLLGTAGSGPAQSDLVKRAHARGLDVHTYTHRNEVQSWAVAFGNAFCDASILHLAS